MNKLCTHCGHTKPISDFHKRSSKNGFGTRKPGTQAYCKNCQAAQSASRKATIKQNPYTSIRWQFPKEDKLLVSAIRLRLACAKDRSKSKIDTAVSVTDEHLYAVFLAQGRCCALTGVPLVLKKRHPLCLSLDQIEPGKGYVVGNVQWVAWCVNFAKGDLPLEDFYDMCRAVIAHRERPA